LVPEDDLVDGDGVTEGARLASSDDDDFDLVLDDDGADDVPADFDVGRASKLEFGVGPPNSVTIVISSVRVWPVLRVVSSGFEVELLLED
ncbi:hypothetical protein IWQ56_001147, partial [Coemansia nantahalensis]